MGGNSVPGPACSYSLRAEDSRGEEGEGWQNCPALRSPTSSLPCPPKGPSAPWASCYLGLGSPTQQAARTGHTRSPAPPPTREARGHAHCCLPSTCPRPPWSPQKELPTILFSRPPVDIIQGPAREGRVCVRRRKQLWELCWESRGGWRVGHSESEGLDKDTTIQGPVSSRIPQPLPSLQPSRCPHLCLLPE